MTPREDLEFCGLQFQHLEKIQPGCTLPRSRKNDGHSEVVFFLSLGENTDGFVLFNATFDKSVTFAWHYH